MEEQIQKEPKPLKPAKMQIDESKLTPPQRKALALAKAQGVPMSRKLKDLVPNLGLTQEEADQFGETIDKIREESRRETVKTFE